MSTAAAGNSDYSLKQKTRLCLSRTLQLRLTTTEDCWRSVWKLIYLMHSAKRKPSSVNMNLWPMRRDGSLCHPASTRIPTSRLETTLTRWPRISSHSQIVFTLSNNWPQNSDLEPILSSTGLRICSPVHSSVQQSLLAICCSPCSPSSSAPLDVSPIVLVQAVAY